MGAKMLAPIKGVNRNIKLNLVSEAFFNKDNKKYDFKDQDWHEKYVESSLVASSLTRRAIDLLQITETKEVFGMTYRDLIEMEPEDFNYLSDTIVKLSNERIERQKKQEQTLEAKHK